jgi:exopolysaccharide production protein ExoQ
MPIDGVSWSVFGPPVKPSAQVQRAASWPQRLSQILLFVIVLRVNGTLSPEFTPVNFEDLTSAAFAMGTSASDLYNQIFWLCIGVGATMCLVSRSSMITPYLRSIWLLPALLLLCVLSALWATHPGISFRRSILLVIGAYSTIVAVLYCRNPAEFLRAVYLAFLVAMLLNLVALAFPFSFDSRHLFRGAVGDKNFLGVIAAVGLALCATWGTQFSSMLMRSLNIMHFGSWVVMIALTGAKTAIVLCVVAPILAVAAAVLTSRLRLALHASLAIVVVTLAAVFQFAVYGLDFSVQDVIGLFIADVSFTGRDVVWQFVLEQFKSHWLLGFGYGSFWGVGLDAENLKSEYNFIQVLTQSHNGYLDVALTTGAAGLVLTIGFLCQITVLVGKIRKANRPLYQFGLLILIFTAVHNFTDSNLVRGVSCLWIMLVAIAAAAAKQSYWAGRPSKA